MQPEISSMLEDLFERQREHLRDEARRPRLTLDTLRGLSKAPKSRQRPWVAPAIDIPPAVTEAMAALAAVTLEVAKSARAPMEIACRAVMALGYRLDECLIEVLELRDAREPGGAFETRRREVLKVRGVPAFETAIVHRLHGVDFTVSVEPRVLTWPDPVPSPEPQSPLVARDE